MSRFGELHTSVSVDWFAFEIVSRLNPLLRRVGP